MDLVSIIITPISQIMTSVIPIIMKSQLLFWVFFLLPVPTVWEECCRTNSHRMGSTFRVKDGVVPSPLWRDGTIRAIVYTP